MALFCEIIQEDGVTTSYHRILYIQSTINMRCSVAVVSYVDESARVKEHENVTAQIYKQGKTYEIAYDETMTPTKAYEYLKTLPEFEGAEDV